ncbi:MAG TPA: MaoC family dehydratase [Rhizomicrobium sp.]
MGATFENLASMTGQEMGVSEWLRIDQDRIDKFAEATNDHQWIHVNVEMAKAMLPDGKTIAHGYLTLSLIPGLTGELMQVEGVTRAINYGSNKVRFVSMVQVGSKVRARVKLVAVEPKSGGLLMTNEVTMEVEGSERPAFVAETLSLLYQ